MELNLDFFTGWIWGLLFWPAFNMAYRQWNKDKDESKQITIYSCECGKKQHELLDFYVQFGQRRIQVVDSGDFCSSACARAWFEKLLDKIEKEGR